MRARGFTLLELLIAATILAVLAALGTRAFVVALAAAKRSEAVMQQVADLERAWFRIEDDLLALRWRPVVNDVGLQEPALGCDEYASTRMILTRGGRAVLQPDPELPVQSSTLERVHYQLIEDRLYRLSWRRLEHFSETPVKRLLLDNVEAMSCVLQSPDTEENNALESDNTLPQAIEVVVQMHSGARYARQFALQIGARF